MGNRAERKLRRMERNRIKREQVKQMQERYRKKQELDIVQATNQIGNNNNNTNNLAAAIPALPRGMISLQEEAHHPQSREYQALYHKEENPNSVPQPGQEPQQEEEEQQAHYYGSWHDPVQIKDALFATTNSNVVVRGQIISAGKIHSMQLIRKDGGGKDDSSLVPRTVEGRAVNVELMDTENYNDIDSLRVVLLDELAQDVRIGEDCMINGVIQLLDLKDRKTGNDSHDMITGSPVLMAKNLRYVRPAIDDMQDSLTQHDIDRVYRFCKYAKEHNDGNDNTIIDRLVSIYAGKRIIGNNEIKEALLYALASTTANLPDGTDINSRRRRLNLGLIGFPGGGKTFVAKSVLKYNARNRFESAQSSSGRSLTAIISREGEGGRILRVGAVAHAKQAICVIDEVGELPIAEQALLQGVMEEGTFTINKHGFNANIRADTVILWTSNPKNATNASARLSYKDLPIRKQILDRTDLIIVMKPLIEPAEREEFNRLKLELERASPSRKKILTFYDEYLKLHLAVMRRKYSNQEDHVFITKECADLINKADVEIQQKRAEGAGSNRTIETLTRLSETIARLKLKDKADASDALRAVQFYSSISTVNMLESLDGTGQTLDTIRNNDPAVLAVDIIKQILKANPGQSYTITELAEQAVELNQTVDAYLGEIQDIRTNRRLRRISDMLVKDRTVAKVGQVPARFMYKEE